MAVTPLHPPAVRREPQMAASRGHGDKLSRKREAAIAALLEEPTVAAAAQRCGVSERTLRRWQREPVFANAYADARRDVMRRSVARIVEAVPQALDVLQAVMRDGAAPAAVRVSAARAVLSGWSAAYDVTGIEDRLAAVEASLGGAGAP